LAVFSAPGGLGGMSQALVHEGFVDDKSHIMINQNHMATSSRTISWRGFTLVELLVVIAPS
jgi:hypothetical protein